MALYFVVKKERERGRKMDRCHEDNRWKIVRSEDFMVEKPRLRESDREKRTCVRAVQIIDWRLEMDKNHRAQWTVFFLRDQPLLPRLL